MHTGTAGRAEAAVAQMGHGRNDAVRAEEPAFIVPRLDHVFRQQATVGEHGQGGAGAGDHVFDRAADRHGCFYHAGVAVIQPDIVDTAALPNARSDHPDVVVQVAELGVKTLHGKQLLGADW
ncbi:MAG: hypothetical protein EBT05_19795, partial [Betaproteobacteria bacterium]|nr:hypothetical protein [Betaproteobacteria bacterium]